MFFTRGTIMTNSLFDAMWKQVGSIISGYLDGVFAGISFNKNFEPSVHNVQSIQVEQTEQHKCRILQFVPRDQLFKLEHKEQQKKTNGTANSKGVFLPFSPKNTESKDVSDEGADMNKQKPILRSDG